MIHIRKQSRHFFRGLNYENRRFKGSIVVSQVGDEISALWLDEEDKDQHVLTGTVNGNSVSGKIEVTDLDETGCEALGSAAFVGIIKGNRVVLYFSYHGTSCDTCRSHGKLSIKIIK